MHIKNRFLSFVIIIFIYFLASLIGLAIFDGVTYPIWLSVLIADVGATLFIWLTSLLFRNASIYDPYWSVQPMVILGLLLISNERATIGAFLLLSVITFWSIRLTYNWAVTFPGLKEQDWRYDQLQEKSGRLFPLVNLAGIQLMPTLIVYACIMPAIYYFERTKPINIISILGLIISIGGIALELVADRQMHAFQKQNLDRTKLIRYGVWRHSRHPNYLGEMMMWWGVYVVMLSSVPQLWYLGAGALINTCLFLFISIPMAERRLSEYKPGFEQYKEETRKLIPIPKHFH